MEQQPRKPSTVAQSISAGTAFAISILLGVFIGRWVDRRWELEPWGVLVGAMLGMAAGFYNLVRGFKDDSRGP